MNIAIIGGGTGLTTAWALENQRKFHVTVFEENDRLGGHIHSIKINNVILEGGAEFIGPPALYPNVHRLFQSLGMALDQFELNMDFDNLKQRDHCFTAFVSYL
ncbi:NAD(P)-binding protein [Legionella pneumophila]|nr:NAD(P)-binding protein [Legionella pneumophila]